MESFENLILNENRTRLVLNNKKKYLFQLACMKELTTGRTDCLFGNYFIMEGIQLLINSITLFEEGFFDCALYQIRQASELCNNMIFIAEDSQKYNTWCSKLKFPADSQVKNQIKETVALYKEIYDKVIFFANYSDYIKSINKIIHKQGYDTFYIFRNNPLRNPNKEDIIGIYETGLKMSIVMLIIQFILVDPVSLLLTDDEIDSRIDFDIMTTKPCVDILNEYCDEDIISIMKDTNVYKELSEPLMNKEKMNDAVYIVKREQGFIIEKLDLINQQKHLLDEKEKIILDLLNNKLSFTKIFPECNFYYYLTSIKDNCVALEFNSFVFDSYSKMNDTFNIEYKNVYRSVIKIKNNNWLIQHNDKFSDIDIDKIKKVVYKYNCE